MQELLDHCAGCPRAAYAPGEFLLREGERSGRLLVLAEGCVEVCRDEVEIARIEDPGALFGEMAMLLDVPHTASVRAMTAVAAYVIDRPTEYLAAHAELALPIARLLARRLQNVTGYLVDLKRQYADRDDHLAMVDEVLETLTHEQGRAFIPAAELPAEP